MAIAKAMERVGKDGVKVVEKEEEELEEEENHGGCNFPKRCTFPLTEHVDTDGRAVLVSSVLV